MPAPILRARPFLNRFSTMQRNIDTSDTYALISQRIPLLKGWAIIWIVAFHLVGNTRGYLDLGEAMTAL